MQSLFRQALRIISAVVMTFTLLAYACPLVNPATFKWLAFFGTAFPWLLLFNILLGIWWGWRRNRFALYHFGIILVGWQFVSGFIGFDMGRDTVPESAITIATHNIGEIFREKKITDEIMKEYTENVPVIPLYFRPEVAVIPKGMKNFKMYGHYFYETLQAESWDIE